MNKKEIKKIVNVVYPLIKNYYGKSTHYDSYPSIKYHYNIYARISGEEGMEGEESPSAEFERETNTIWIYYPKATDKKWVIQTLIHEYTHYLQDGEEMKRLYSEGYEYNNHPFELEATKSEENWIMFGKAK